MKPTIPWVKPHFAEEDITSVADAVRSSWISGGPCVEKLEAQFRDLLGVADALAVANGTVAIELALLGLGIGPGDEVIVPNFGFVAAANMIKAVGATVVLADIDPEHWCLDLAQLEALCGPRTRAILPIHTYGLACDIQGLQAFCRARKLHLIEDAAESIFSRQSGHYHGTVGEVGTFSFHATKTITTGEGGLVVTRDPELGRRMRVIRDHGMNKARRYWHEVEGRNFRMTNMQAALGCSQFSRKDHFIAERARLFAHYERRLARLDVKMQARSPHDEPVMWAVGVRLPARLAGEPRDRLIAAMLEQGIELRPGFFPLSVMPPFRDSRRPSSLAVSEEVAAEMIALPFYVGLTESEIDGIVARLEENLR